MKIDIFNDGIGYVTDEVSTIHVTESNMNENNRIKFVTDLAAVSRGKDASNNPAKRYASLLEEAAPTYETIDMVTRFSTEEKKDFRKSPSRPVEFLPVVIKFKVITIGEDPLIELYDTNGNKLMDGDESITYSIMCFANMIARHSYIQENNIYTNMRCLLNATIPYNSIPYNTPEELKDFRAIKANIPMYIWAQVPNTHTMISKEAQSDRVAENTRYWLPADFRERVYQYSLKHAYEYKEFEAKEILDKDDYILARYGSYPSLVFAKLTTELLGLRDFTQAPYLLINGRVETNLSPTQYDIQMYFKELGYHREIWSRAMYYFKYKEVVMTGWNNDPKVWEHLFLERSVRPEINKNWTQNETKTFVICMDQIINQK